MKNKSLILWRGLILAALSAWAGGAQATLLDGKTIEYQRLVPDISTSIPSPGNGNHVVGPGVEIGNFNTTSNNLGSLDISDTNLLVNFNCGGSCTSFAFLNVSFNGFRITDILGTIDAFTSVTINAATNMVGFDSSRVSFDVDHIWVNFQGLGGNNDTIVSLDINGGSNNRSVPEPGTLLLLGAGALGLARRRQPALRS